MRIISYRDLAPGRFAKSVQKIGAALARGDFAAAGLKKLSPTPYWRAKLNDEARLLMQFAPHRGETVCLFLEVIPNHVYEKSRFLRGAAIDWSKIESGPDDAAPQPEPTPRGGLELRWLPAQAAEFELLDRPIVFDEAQEAVRRHKVPLVVVGSAGSGKTAVTLAKMREATGRVLYVTHSAYLAQTARKLYSAHGYENPAQDVEFMSFREFVDSIAVPEGVEALSEQRQVVCVGRSKRRPKRRLGREGAPLGQRGGAPLFVNLAGDEMALLIEMVVDLGMN